jgi:hypothetical protein
MPWLDEVTIRCGTCAAFMGYRPPFEGRTTVRGLCAECHERGTAVAFEGARTGVRMLDQVLASARGDVLEYLARELGRLHARAAATSGPVALRAPSVARRGRA